tara:strand:+ start:36 stop:272 length:237 start_codon:yes stop_codon:yes gene_type:complete
MHLRLIIFILFYFKKENIFYKKYYSLTLLRVSESIFLGVGFKPKSFLPVKKNTTTREKNPKIATVCMISNNFKYTLKT